MLTLDPDAQECLWLWYGVSQKGMWQIWEFAMQMVRGCGQAWRQNKVAVQIYQVYLSTHLKSGQKHLLNIGVKQQGQVWCVNNQYYQRNGPKAIYISFVASPASQKVRIRRASMQIKIYNTSSHALFLQVQRNFTFTIVLFLSSGSIILISFIYRKTI